MNLHCLVAGHNEECGLLDKEGKWYKAMLFELSSKIPAKGSFEVYWKCHRCGRIRKSIWK